MKWLLLLALIIVPRLKGEPSNEDWLQAVRAGALSAEAGPNLIRLRNDQLAVQFDKTKNCWDAVWLQKAEGAIRGASFAVECDGRTIKPQSALTTVRPFTNQFGTGTEIRQRWTNGVQIEFFLRLYDAGSGVIVGGADYKFDRGQCQPRHRALD